jgi:hypothetical protein
MDRLVASGQLRLLAEIPEIGDDPAYVILER